MPIIYPNGVKPGCLPRVSKVGARWPVADEVIDIKPQYEWLEFIETDTSLMKYRPWTLYQNGIGSCGTETITAAVGYLQKRQTGHAPKLNPWSVYWKTSGGRDRGSSLDENLEYVRDHGICPDSVWPRYGEGDRVINPWNREPSDEAKEVARNHCILEFCDAVSLLHVGSLLCAKLPVMFGWQGHACLLVKLLDEWQAVYDNWWKTGWNSSEWQEYGDGYGMIDLREIDFRYGAFGLMSATYLQAT